MQQHLGSSAGVAGKDGSRSSASTTASDGESASDEDSASRAAGKLSTMQVEIALNGQILGIDINYHDGLTLLVTRVRRGPVVAHNLANPDQAVLVGDRLATINGSKGDAKLLFGGRQARSYHEGGHPERCRAHAPAWWLEARSGPRGYRAWD